MGVANESKEIVLSDEAVVVVWLVLRAIEERADDLDGCSGYPYRSDGSERRTFPVHCATKTMPVVQSFFVCPAVFWALQVYSIGSELASAPSSMIHR